MVVKSATKKKLMDMGVQEEFSHKLADDRKWDDVKILSPGEIAQICGLSSEEATAIHNTLQTYGKSGGPDSSSATTTVVRRKKAIRRTTQKLDLQEFDKATKEETIGRDIDKEDTIYQTLVKAAEKEGFQLTERLLENLAAGVRERGKAKLTPTQAKKIVTGAATQFSRCLLYTSPSPRDRG